MDIGDSTISIYILIFVMGGGFLAGFVDAIAGGGGLISLPVLLATGMPPHLAIGTNKFSATFGAVMSAWQFWRAGKVDVHLMKIALPCTFVGAVLGCACMLHLSAQWLQPIIIAALVATILFVFSRGSSMGAVNTYQGETKKNLALPWPQPALSDFTTVSSVPAREPFSSWPLFPWALISSSPPATPRC